MRRTIMLVSCALVALATSASAAQLYRWVDQKGNVEWRDTPPPATAKQVEQRAIQTSTIPTSDWPYSLQRAVKNFPVTLWATDCGDLCDRARAHLARRGVPYTDKDPQSDFEGFKKASGGGAEVPLLMIGSTRLKGYLESDWDAALDLAGYPKTALVSIKPKATPKSAATKPAAVKLYTSAECGPRCGQAKALLQARGVPFQEIVVDGPTVVEELKKIAGGEVFVPTLVAGRRYVRGFDAADYQSALDQAGFRQAQAAAKP